MGFSDFVILLKGINKQSRRVKDLEESVAVLVKDNNILYNKYEDLKLEHKKLIDALGNLKKEIKDGNT